MKITKIGERTFLAGVTRLVAEAEASKSRLQTLSDRAAFYLTLIAIFSGGLTFIFWILAKGGASFALERLVAVLVIACPHALGLAVPLVASISTTLAARHGFLVRQRLALEIAREISVILFDKTGTLTRGEYGVTRIIANEREYDENEILRLASSVDAYSEHFISKAIVAEAKKRNLEFHDVKHFQRVAGKGVRGEIKNEVIFAGGEAILTETNAVVPAELKFEIEKSANQGKTIIYVVVKSKLAGVIALADIIREESKEAVAELKKIGVETMMITGDSEEVARWAAEELGIDKYFARVLPGEKAEIVRMLQNSKSEFELFLIKHKIQHIPSRRKNPQTNGKLERFWQEYNRHRWRFKKLEEFLDWYNARLHGALRLDWAETPNEAFIRKR
ncbi:MAG: HAD-IC family P-type ATPase, partial [Patescibacteria group bacterium]